MGCERRIWKFLHFNEMKDAMVLRNGLAPYIYTQVRASLDDSVALLHPMYYEMPDDDAAYTFSTTQYFFGSEMIVAPIATPASTPINGTVSKAVWLPDGEFVDWHAEETYTGPVVVTKTYTHSDIPVFVRAGSLIPMKTMSGVNETSPDLEWTIFTSKVVNSGVGYSYEDDGETDAHRSKTEYAILTAQYNAVPCEHDQGRSRWKEIAFTINTDGGYNSAPTERGHALVLKGVSNVPQDVVVNGVSYKHGASVTTVTSTSNTGAALELSMLLGGSSLKVDVGQHGFKEPLEIHLLFSC